MTTATLLALLFTGSHPATILSAQLPVFLKLNQYYVLYTYPRPPFIDEAGHIMVPVEVISKLMGLDASVDPTAGLSAVVQRDNVRLTLFAGHPTGEVDSPQKPGVPRRIHVVPPPRLIGPTRDMFIPISVLSEAFGIPAKWEPRHRILALSDRRLMSGLSAVEMFEWRLPDDTEDTGRLVPEAFDLRKAQIPERRAFRMTLLLRNVSGRDIPYGRQALYTLAEYMGGPASFSGRDIYGSPDIGRTKDPCVKSPGGFKCVELLDIMRSPIKYIAFRVRLQK